MHQHAHPQVASTGRQFLQSGIFVAALDGILPRISLLPFHVLVVPPAARRRQRQQAKCLISQRQQQQQQQQQQ